MYGRAEGSSVASAFQVATRSKKIEETGIYISEENDHEMLKFIK